MLNLRQLEIFREVMRCQTTVAAAQGLGLSQPTVSNSIKHMEAQLGFQLFERRGNRLVPTPEALEMFQDSDPIFSMVRTFSRKLASIRDTRVGSLRLLATPPIANAIVPTALRKFVATRPEVHVSFDVRPTEGVIEGIESGFADIGVSLEPYARPGLEFELIGAGQMVCAFPPGHALADKSEVSLSMLERFPVIGYEPGSRLGLLLQRDFFDNRVPHSAIEVRYSNTACLLAESGLGVALVDSFTSVYGERYRLETRPLQPRTAVEAYALYQKARTPRRLVRAFIDQLKQSFESQPAY
jgi:DNA-binding transcriptional LysR family regulator